MSDPIEEASSELFFNMARTCVNFCRRHGMQPAETVACLSTAIAIAVFGSGNEWTKEALQSVDEVVQMMIASQSPPPPR